MMANDSVSRVSSARARSWNRSLSASPGALDLEIPADRIEGAIPAALFHGRLLSNGPGWNVIGERIVHPFDGHGYVRALSFRPDGSVRLIARFVDTPSYRAESAAGRLVQRGLATNLDGPFWRNVFANRSLRGLGLGRRNVANTTILRWNDRLLAGWEGGAPHALDPDTLATRGEEHFGGAIAGQASLAHMKHDATRDRLIVCSVKLGRRSGFTFREIGRDDRVQATHTATIPATLFTHDFAPTPNWLVLGGNPLKVNLLELARALAGRSTLVRSIATDSSAPPALHLVHRGSGATRTVKLPSPAWIIHFGNAFERDGDVIVHACVFHGFNFGEEFGYTGPNTPFDPTLPDKRDPQRLYRITVPRGSDEARWERLCPHGVDFPRFHPAHEGLDTPALYGATRADTRYSDPFDSVLRVDLVDRDRPPSLWTVPEDRFVGEPIFVPDPAKPASGYLLVIVSHGLEDKSSLVVLAADALEQGPLAVVPLPLLPVAFHGDWEGP